VRNSGPHLLPRPDFSRSSATGRCAVRVSGGRCPAAMLVVEWADAISASVQLTNALYRRDFGGGRLRRWAACHTVAAGTLVSIGVARYRRARNDYDLLLERLLPLRGRCCSALPTAVPDHPLAHFAAAFVTPTSGEGVGRPRAAPVTLHAAGIDTGERHASACR
jgi:hypothetical protein